MNKRQLQGVVMQMISELDEIISGEGGRAVGQLRRCRAKLQRLAKCLEPSRPGEYVRGSELLLLVSEAMRLLYTWVRRD